MSLTLNAEALEWQARLRAFVDEELIPNEVTAELNGGRLPEEVRKRHRRFAARWCLGGMDAPREQGGLALSNQAQVAIYEQIGRATNGLGWCFGEAHRWMFDACTPQQIEKYVLPIMRDEKQECYAITEEGAGSEVDDIVTSATPVAGGYRISGEKWFVTSGNIAHYFVLQAKIAAGPNAGSHAMFFIDKEEPGIELVRSPAFTHSYNDEHPVYRFTDVFVPAENLIGREGDGMGFAHVWFRRERLMIAARSCGTAQRLIDEASDYAKKRTVSGSPIADYQAIQFMLADSLTELWAARLMTYECAAAHDRGEEPKHLHALCSMVKLYASEMVGRVADRAVQIFGGRGYMRENVAERFYREVRVDRIWEGTSEIQRLIIARALLKRGIDGTIGR